ncbi:MAG: heat-inducible transcription repressor HrcA [Chloroflexi bacterium]|nr:heat-inducible transcription repressor HrcA [Chloroflexota bacterium]
MPDNLTERQQRLLASLIWEYIGNPEPVSSSRLQTASGLQVSSATIRNEMVVLEDKGLIRSPHTSSGRVPTETGYRYFVKYLLEHVELPQPPVDLIRAQFKETPAEIDAWMQTATVILAQETQSAALVTDPRIWTEHRFKHLQLIGIQGRLVLMVLVLTSGHVHQQMLVMAEPVHQEALSKASEAINRIALDKTAAEIYEVCRHLTSTLSHEIGELTADALQQMNNLGSKIRFQAGLSDVLAHLEDEGAKQAVRVLEGGAGLDEIVNQMADKQVGTVQVIVAGEGRWEEFSHLSMVLGRYGTGRLMGAIGVLGPTRMRYGKAISTVGYVAELISNLLSEAHGIEAPEVDEDDS